MVFRECVIAWIKRRFEFQNGFSLSRSLHFVAHSGRGLFLKLPPSALPSSASIASVTFSTAFAITLMSAQSGSIAFAMAFAIAVDDVDGRAEGRNYH